MPLSQTRPLSELPPDLYKEAVNCYTMQRLYWEREETENPDLMAAIDRRFVKFLLEHSEDAEVFAKFDLTPLEEVRLKKMQEVTDGMRAKVRIFAQDFTRDTVGT